MLVLAPSVLHGRAPLRRASRKHGASSNAASPARPADGARGSAEPAAAAIAPAATSPPSANERRGPPPTPGAVHPRPCDHPTLRLVSLGDLLLDVIVRLDARSCPATTAWPSPVSARAGRPRTSPPGRPCSAPRRGSSASAARTRQASSPLPSSPRTAFEIDGPVEGRNGVVVSFAAAGDRTMASDRGVAPQLRPDELDPRGSTATCFTSPATRSCASRSLRRRSAAPARPRVTARASLSTSRPGRSVDEAVPRARPRVARPTLVFANERGA